MTILFKLGVHEARSSCLLWFEAKARVGFECEFVRAAGWVLTCRSSLAVISYSLLRCPLIVACCCFRRLLVDRDTLGCLHLVREKRYGCSLRKKRWLHEPWRGPPLTCDRSAYCWGASNDILLFAEIGRDVCFGWCSKCSSNKALCTSIKSQKKEKIVSATMQAGL